MTIPPTNNELANAAKVIAKPYTDADLRTMVNLHSMPLNGSSHALATLASELIAARQLLKSAYTIKPPKWEGKDPTPDPSYIGELRGYWWWYVHDGEYRVYKTPAGYQWSFLPHNGGAELRYCDSIEHGKRLAWEHWQARILPALVPVKGGE